MDGRYRDAIAEASGILAEAMLEDSDVLIEQGRQLDLKVKRLLWALGSMLVRTLFHQLQARLVERANSEELTVERRKTVCFKVLFGPVEVESVYMYDRTSGAGLRPLKEHAGEKNRSIRCLR